MKIQNILRFIPFPVIMNTIIQIAFKNVYKSSIIFQSSLYANILLNLCLMGPLSFIRKQTKLTDIVLFCLNPLKLKSSFSIFDCHVIIGIHIRLPYEDCDTYPFG